MELSEKKAAIEAAMKAALRAKDKQTLGTVRLILAEIQRIEIDERCAVDDTRVMATLDKMLKQRRDSIEQFQHAGRDELVAQEQTEIAVIQSFLPTPLDEQEIASLIATAITDSGATSIKEMGRVMAQLKPKLQGRADIGAVSGKVKAALV